ncbi:MAG: trypsin-like peptidase domain-containing protein [Patescibacteria group bacterium]|nr:trypsin-like peptidase domain-containing protein [Patescibacteria group bacterium]
MRKVYLFITILFLMFIGNLNNVVAGSYYNLTKSWECDVSYGKIDSISPTKILPFNVITINGSGFGENLGSIYFVDPTNELAFIESPGLGDNIRSWSDNKIEYHLNMSGNPGNSTRGDTEQFRQGIMSSGYIFVVPKDLNAISENGLDVSICAENIADSSWSLACVDEWQCTDWNVCSETGFQRRTCSLSYDCNGVEGISPETERDCWPTCTSLNWSCTSWNSCSPNGQQTRTCDKVSDCRGGISAPGTSQSCTYIPECTSSSWSCGSWSTCSSNGTQSRSCNKTSNCEGGTQSPVTSQSCTYTPACSADTWNCGNWGTCSPQGVQTRSCSRSYDCPSAETAAPATSQYCEAPQQNYQTPPSDSDIVVNQNTIVKATVKLVCPVSNTMASQGSGTVINSTGLILTNKHVVDGTAGCWVGFIDDYDDEPYFGDRQIADIYKVSSDADVAVLKMRNPSNKTLTSVNISQSNSSNIQLGEILTTYGYPAKFGTKITYTSGDFSGVDGNYLKTTAIIEHGNSGGGAYLKNGTFIGIPTAVVKGSLNSLGYLLSVNKINSWLNNSIAYNYSTNNNNYSRVSAMLEDMDLSTIDSLGLYITGDEENVKIETESNNVIEDEKSLITKIDNALSQRVSGNILLQVEKNGEGWYVFPDDKKKYYLGRPADAFTIMRNLGLGIKHSELTSYLNSKFPSRLSGKILLDVEQNGEAYYINPINLKGYYLNRPADAFSIMREFGLGITNSDIRKIDVGEIQ